MAVDRLVRDITSLVDKGPAKNQLKPAKKRQPIKPGLGVGLPSNPAQADGGITAPLTYVSNTTRTETIDTTCGTVDIEVITEVTVSDANGMQFSIPFE